MGLLQQLAEARIREAIEAGELDNLAGRGRPLQLDDDRLVPEGLRAGYRLLKNAGYLPPEHLMNDETCADCHGDINDSHNHSMHRFSSFNNPAYKFSVEETREVVYKRDGNMHAARFCAACHDPVPLFSGAFDDPRFGTAEDSLANAGITCTACHGPQGNSMSALWPNLAGQNAPYIQAQLQAFKDGSRSDPLMTPQAMLLSDEDIADLAVYFEGLPEAQQAVKDANLVDRGEAIYRGGKLDALLAA